MELDRAFESAVILAWEDLANVSDLGFVKGPAVRGPFSNPGRT